MRRLLLIPTLVLVLAGCGSYLDERCYLRPTSNSDNGLCDMVLPNWAYVAEAGRCAQGGGCSCDADCQANELPFSSEEECEAVCMPAK